MTIAARSRALPRREPRRDFPPLAVLVLALAAFSSTGCVTFRRPEVAFHGVEVRSFGSAGAELAATFEVTNHNSYAIQLDHFTYRVTINGGEAGGASVDGVTTLPGHETTLVHMGLSLDWGKLKDVGLQFFTHGDDSLLEQLQREYGAIRFVKAFNSVGSAHMVDPSFHGGPPTMFICGNDAPAKTAVRGIVEAFGWEAADMGTAVAARAIEPLCMLWCIPGLRDNQWSHAFKLLKPV